MGMPGAKRILVVCTGNSCRSVMAKGLLKKMLQDHGKSAMVVSAGIAALPGLRPTRETMDVMARHDIDVSTHLTQRLTNDMVESADLVLVMERIHREEILNRIPHAKKKVFLLREYAGAASGHAADIEVPDPIAKPIDVYESCFEMIEAAVDKVVEKI